MNKQSDTTKSNDSPPCEFEKTPLHVDRGAIHSAISDSELQTLMFVTEPLFLLFELFSCNLCI
jgi:hypothetical protein